MLISVIMWGCLVFLHLVLLLTSHVNVWRIYLLGALAQIVLIFSFRHFRKYREG